MLLAGLVDGLRRDSHAGCVSSVCSPNKSRFTGRFSSLFSWKTCRGEGLAKTGVGEKLWDFSPSSVCCQGHAEQGWGLRKGLCRAQQEVEGWTAPHKESLAWGKKGGFSCCTPLALSCCNPMPQFPSFLQEGDSFPLPSRSCISPQPHLE